MRLKKRFQGMGVHRINREPLEKRFAEAWQRINDTSRPGLAKSNLDYLMDEKNRGEPVPPLSDRDWKISSTVVQWLGSHVGQCFLADVLSGKDAEGFRERLKREVEEKKLRRKAG